MKINTIEILNFPRSSLSSVSASSMFTKEFPIENPPRPGDLIHFLGYKNENENGNKIFVSNPALVHVPV